MPDYMSLDKARETASMPEVLAEKIGVPYPDWDRNCHAISLELLKTGLFGPGRIARGWADGVTGQHSWIVLGDDVYRRSAVIVDPTIIFYLTRAGKAGSLKGIQVGTAARLGHRPRGAGSIWSWGKPGSPEDEIITLTPSFKLSGEAEMFLSDAILGPLDRKGWSQLANGAMQDWPAGEIIAAMDDTPELSALVPIDILGHVTNRNPGGLYLADVPDTSAKSPDPEPERPGGPTLKELWDSPLFIAGIALGILALALIVGGLI